MQSGRKLADLSQDPAESHEMAGLIPGPSTWGTPFTRRSFVVDNLDDAKY